MLRLPRPVGNAFCMGQVSFGGESPGESCHLGNHLIYECSDGTPITVHGCRSKNKGHSRLSFDILCQVKVNYPLDSLCGDMPICTYSVPDMGQLKQPLKKENNG